MSDRSFISLYDMHVGFEHVFDSPNSRWKYQPTHDEKFIKKVFTFIQDLAPTHVIFGGDQFDFSSISRFNKDSKVAAVGEALEKEYLEWERIFGKNLCALVHFNVPFFTWLIGNHDDRTTEFTSKYPQLTGLIDPVKYLKLKDLGVNIKNRGELYNLGKLWFTHGDQIRASGDIAKNAALHYNRNIRFGHFHTLRSYTLHSAVDAKDVKTAIGVPAMTHRSAAWGKNRPNQCLQGFGYGFVSKKGNFSDYQVVNTPEGFVINGKRY